MTDSEDRPRGELAMTVERDMAGKLLARIVVALEPGREHWDEVDIDALPGRVEALVEEVDRLTVQREEWSVELARVQADADMRYNEIEAFVRTVEGLEAELADAMCNSQSAEGALHDAEDERDRLNRALESAISYVAALEGQKESVVKRARQSYEAALDALDEAERATGGDDEEDGSDG